VWWLCAAIAVVAVAVVVDVWYRAPLSDAPLAMPWWALIPMFYAAERTVVHFSFNRHSHSFSLSEIPLVLGLFFASPAAVVVGHAAGSLIALSLHRRQNLQKLVFNVVQFTLQAALAIVVFRAVIGSADPLGLRAAFAALCGVAAALVLANLVVNSAIWLSGGRMTRADVLKVLSSRCHGGRHERGPRSRGGQHRLVATEFALWIALVPPVLLFLAYRAQVSQRQEHARLTAMYEATRELHRTPAARRGRPGRGQTGGRHVRRRASEIVLFQGDERADVFLTSVASGTERSMELVGPGASTLSSGRSWTPGRAVAADGSRQEAARRDGRPAAHRRRGHRRVRGSRSRERPRRVLAHGSDLARDPGVAALGLAGERQAGGVARRTP
jgi:hypothetical protein